MKRLVYGFIITLAIIWSTAISLAQQDAPCGGPTFDPSVPGATMTDSNGKPLPLPSPECKAAAEKAAKQVPSVPNVFPLPSGVTFSNVTDTSVRLSANTSFGRQVISSLKPDWIISIPKSGGYCNGNRLLARVTSVTPNSTGVDLYMQPLTPPYTCAGS